MGLTPSHVLSLTHRRKRRTKAPWAVISAFRGLAGQHSYFSHHEILGEAAVRAQDRGVSIEHLRKTTQKYLKESPQAVKLQEQIYTSAKNLETEDRLLALAEQMSTVEDHQVHVKRLERYLLRNSEQRQSLFRTNKPGHVLTWEQSAALAHMTSRLPSNGCRKPMIMTST